MQNIESFYPGENVNTLNIYRRRNLKNHYIKSTFPSRVHITPIDCNRFDFGHPGGGGIGFAIELGNTVSFRADEKLSIHLDDTKFIPIIKHYIKLMQNITESEDQFKIELNMNRIIKQHFGLGSSVCIACAVMYTLNELYGSVLTIDEIRQLIAHNFVEEYKGKLTKGLETGVGTSVVLRGGLSVVANNIIEVFNKPVPEDFIVLIIDPKTSRPDSEAPESIDMLKRTFFLDSSYRYIKSYDILMDMIPALDTVDFQKFGNYIWDIQFSGTHLSMIQSYKNHGQSIYEILSFLRSLPIEVCGLSSVGPAIFCLIRNDKTSEIEKAFTEYPKQLEYHFFKPNNKGIIISKN